MWVPVDEEATAVRALLAAGFAVAAGERFRLSSRPAIRVTIARLDEWDAPQVAAALSGALEVRGRTYTA